MKVCCGFGHRNVFESINVELDNAINTAIQQGCELFYTGAMGEFDSLLSSAVRRAKKAHPYINKRDSLATPYFMDRHLSVVL